MSTSLDTQRYARRLFLEIRALSLELQVEEDPDAPGGHTVKLVGTKSLTPRHAERLARRVGAGCGGSGACRANVESIR